MIKSLRLINFRGFVDHTVEFAPFTLLTGQNNAGKTTIIEALRVISVAQSKTKNARYENAPSEFDQFVTGAVFRFSLKTIDFDESNIHHNYRTNEPAIIKMTLTNNCKVTVYLGRDPADRYCQLQFAGGQKVHSRADGCSGQFHQVFVMPPVGSLLANETARDKRYLRENINGYLSYRHIRNQMADMPSEFQRFKTELEKTWEGLQVRSLEYVHREDGSHYELEIRDGRYPAEVARLGSGLQAWIQTLWFLSRVNLGGIIVLDEPDVYLHADLQKKLIRLLGQSEYRQKVVATHSIEMISDVSPEEVIEVQKSETRSRPIFSRSDVQAVLDHLGTSHHIQLSKLGKTGTVLFIEGKDHKFLGQLALKLGRQYSKKFEQIPRFTIGGLGNWQKAAMTAKVLHDTSDGGLNVRLLLDRDYFHQGRIDEIVRQARENKLEIIFWNRKEIENFFLDSEVIWNFIQKHSQKKVDRYHIDEKMNEIVDDLFDNLLAQLAQDIQTSDRRLTIPSAMNEANKVIKERLDNGNTKADLVSGKAVFSALSDFSQSQFGVSLSPIGICREMPPSRVPAEITEVVKTVCL